MASITISPIEIVLLTVLMISAVVAVRILFVLSSRRHRHRYTRLVRVDFLLGLIAGLLLPWNEPIGVGAAALLSVIFVAMAAYYLLRIRFAQTFPTALWPTRETFRDWFLHFSISTGVIGIISTLLSIIVPPFLSLSLGSIVPLTFDGLSVLSALLEFTIPIPHYSLIYALLYRRLSGKGENQNLVETAEVNWIELNADFARAEIIDGLENLVQQGLAERKRQTSGKRLNYLLLPHGMELLEYDYKEMEARMSNDLERIGRALTVVQGSSMDSRWKRKIRRQLLTRLEKISGEYGPLLDAKWMSEIYQRLGQTWGRDSV